MSLPKAKEYNLKKILDILDDKEWMTAKEIQRQMPDMTVSRVAQTIKSRHQGRIEILREPWRVLKYRKMTGNPFQGREHIPP